MPPDHVGDTGDGLRRTARVGPDALDPRARSPSVARAVWVASALTSLATTAKPLPASPARAASIVAFSANRLVWLAIWAINCNEDLADIVGRRGPSPSTTATGYARVSWVASRASLRRLFDRVPRPRRCWPPSASADAGHGLDVLARLMRRLGDRGRLARRVLGDPRHLLGGARRSRPEAADTLSSTTAALDVALEACGPCRPRSGRTRFSARRASSAPCSPLASPRLAPAIVP